MTDGRRTLLVGVVMGAVVALLLLVGSALGRSPEVRSGPLTPRPIAAVLRDYPAGSPEGSGWHVMRTGGHVPIGVGSVSCAGAVLHLTLNPAAVSVASVVATADETYVQRDMILGTWLTVGEVGLRMEDARTGATIRCDDTTLRSDTANIWVLGWVYGE
jgi:hypothetical protein